MGAAILDGSAIAEVYRAERLQANTQVKGPISRQKRCRRSKRGSAGGSGVAVPQQAAAAAFEQIEASGAPKVNRAQAAVVALVIVAEAG